MHSVLSSELDIGKWYKEMWEDILTHNKEILKKVMSSVFFLALKKLRWRFIIRRKVVPKCY